MRLRFEPGTWVSYKGATETALLMPGLSLFSHLAGIRSISEARYCLCAFVTLWFKILQLPPYTRSLHLCGSCPGCQPCCHCKWQLSLNGGLCEGRPLEDPPCRTPHAIITALCSLECEGLQICRRHDSGLRFLLKDNLSRKATLPAGGFSPAHYNRLRWLCITMEERTTL